MARTNRLDGPGRGRLVALALLAGLFWLSPLVAQRPPSPARTPDVAFIRGLVDRLSEADLRRDVVALQECGSRFAPGRGNLRAAEYLKSQFVAAGLTDVSFDEFSYYDPDTGAWKTTRNVVAAKRGAGTPERIVVIGAHFDTIVHARDDERGSAFDPDTPSPGADDNGTGVAAVVAAARLLAPLPSDSTIRFVLFSAEEAGIFGGAHYAAACARKGEHIAAMLNLDMIGYVKEDPEDLDLLANRPSTWLLDRIIRSGAAYAPSLLLQRIVDDTYDGSDHGPFWNNGFPAVCFMDDYYPSSPYYHTAADTADHIDGRFFLDSARLAIGAAAELAGIQDPSRTTAASPGQATTAPASSPAPARGPSRDVVMATLGAEANQTRIVSLSGGRVSAQTTIPLAREIGERWSAPRYYPVDISARPASHLLYVPAASIRAPAGRAETGRVQIVDASSARVVGAFPVGPDPTRGAFNETGTHYYQPYHGVWAIDVFDTTRLTLIRRIPSPVPLARVAVARGEKRAVAVSTESDTILVFDLQRGLVEGEVRGVPAPTDVLMVDDDLALVASGSQPTIVEVDLSAKRVAVERPVGSGPIRLAISPLRDVVACLHVGGDQMEVFDVDRSSHPSTLRPRPTLDLHEAVMDAALAAADTCYVVSAGRRRIVGLSLQTGKVFWAIRTGGVRARADTDRVVLVGGR